MFPDQQKAEFYDAEVHYVDGRLKVERRWLLGSRIWLWCLLLGGLFFFAWSLLDVYEATFRGEQYRWINAVSHVILGWFWACHLRKRHLKSMAHGIAHIEKLVERRAFARLQADLYREESADADPEAR